MTHRRRSLTVVTITVLVGTLWSTANAQKLADDPDMKELAGYRLTIDMLKRIDRATRDMAEAMKKDPRYAERTKLEEELTALQKKDDPSEADQKRIAELEAKKEEAEKAEPAILRDAKSLSDMEASLKQFPPLARALAKENIAPREYVKFMMAMLQASMAAAMQKAGVPMPEGVNPENVKFVTAYDTELKKMVQPSP